MGSTAPPLRCDYFPTALETAHSTITMTVTTECNVCKQTTGLSCCARCRMVFYCSRDHQKDDFKAHKRQCKLVKVSLDEYQEEETKLRNAPEDDWMPANVFEEGVGRFWRIQGTREYMMTKFRYLEAVIRIGTPTALIKGLEEGLDCLRLNRGDSMGVRDHIPAIYIRLHRFQDCYDFIKWWETCDPDGRYDWSDPSLPYLNVKNADITESVSFCEHTHSLSFLGALTFIKFYIAQGLSDVINAKAASANLPGGLESAVTAYLPLSEMATAAADPRRCRRRSQPRPRRRSRWRMSTTSTTGRPYSIRPR